ncbi:MAG: S8 family serine peptidase [Saprospiraceae bacterium]|nr:S8 family serine peptidase [Saprospiraceae bacterium]
MNSQCIVMLNNMMNKYLTVLAIFVVWVSNAQKIENELVIQSRLSSAHLSEKIQIYQRNLDAQILSPELLSEDLGLYKIVFSRDITLDELDQISKISGIEFAVYNEYLQLRDSPNDTYFSDQWALAFAKIPKIWEVTTGGTTYDGKEIVIAVLDDGVDITHEDLKDNIFINTREIPGDKIDNDGNGYVDDYYGYNVDLKNGTPVSESHGTGVLGIMGALSNNSKGVSGINWKIKLLPIYGVNNLDEIISAYAYVLKLKRLYLSTKGEKGAFILVTNYSGGIAEAWGNVEPYKQWCAMYDLLGNEGVLSVGATDNLAVNVDLIGDMPSTCTSEFFISTTNIDKTGTKVLRAGFGPKYIAMGAPGQDLVTLGKNNSYVEEFSGTSASAPMVAGTIALLFSVPCASFATLIAEDKVAAARAVKDAIANGVTRSESLIKQTRFGGYLNGEASLALMDAPCEGTLLLPSPKGEMKIISLKSEAGTLTLEYLTPDENGYSVMISNLLGQIYYRNPIDVPEYGSKMLTIDSNLIPHGIYIISISGPGGIASSMVYSHQ